MKRFGIVVAVAASVVFTASTADASATFERAPHGTAQNGETVDIVALINDHGLRVRFRGGMITEIDAPYRNGRLDDIVLTLKNIRDYETLRPHLGAITGRFANRIGRAQFTLDGQTYHLIANDGANTLHGGPDALDRKVWTVTPISTPDAAASLSYVSPDGDQNFPGKLTVKVTYSPSNDNEFRIDYEAETDKDTVLNLPNHSYFNLAGKGSGSVAGQMLLLNADTYMPVRPDQVPTGKIASVAGTPLDFRQMMPIGARLNSAFQQMVYAQGYDHNWVINRRPGDALVFAGRGYDPHTGRVLDCFTTEPGVQVYTANGLKGSIVGSSGTAYRKGEAFTLETQHFPDSPNKPNFPSTVLTPGQTFHSTPLSSASPPTPPSRHSRNSGGV